MSQPCGEGVYEMVGANLRAQGRYKKATGEATESENSDKERRKARQMTGRNPKRAEVVK